MGQNVQSWPQQQSISIDAQHQSTLHHPQPAPLILSQPSPQLLLAHPAGSGASFGVNPISNYLAAPIQAMPAGVQPVPFIMCAPSASAPLANAHVLHVQDDKFRNIWLSQEVIPACQIANEKYVSNFVVAHNNTVMASKDAAAMVFLLLLLLVFKK